MSLRGTAFALAACLATESVVRFELATQSAWAAEERPTDLTRFEDAPVSSMRGRPLPADHLPMGFDDLASFHQGLVAETEGYFQIAYQDVAISGVGPALEVRRRYTSHTDRESAFGEGWSWNFGARLRRDDDTGEPVIRDADNLRVHFREFGGEYVSINTAIPERLEWTSAEAVRTFSDNSKQYFSGGGRLTAIVDARGRRLDLRYTGTKLTEAVDATGRSLRFTYAGNHIATVTDPLGREWRYDYDGDLLRAVTDPVGRRTKFTYLPKFGWRQRMSHVVFPNGADMTVFYHPLSKRVIRIAGPGPMSTSFRYSVNSYERTMRKWITDPRGHRSEVLFEAKALKANEPEGDSAEPEMLYLDKRDIGAWRYMQSETTYKDAEGEKRRTVSTEAETVIRDAKDRETHIAKDASGRMAQITDPLDRQTRVSWDALAGKVSRIGLPNGGTMTFEYQEGELRGVTDPLGNTTRMDPVAAQGGAKAYRVVDASGIAQTIEFDEYDNPVCLRDAAGGEWRMSYDLAGRLLEVTDPAGASREYVYDAADNVVEARDAAGGVTRTSYDELDNVTRLIDPDGRETRLTYDQRGLLEEGVFPGGLRMRCEYDRVGNLLSIRRSSAGRELTAKTTYDKNDRLESTEDPLGRVFRYAYDATGMVKRLVAPRGGEFEFRHDAGGRLTEERFPDGSVIEREYGDGAEPERVRYASENGESRSLAYEYDAAGRMIRVRGAAGVLREFGYDRAGRLLSIAAGAEVHSQKYDDVGRLAEARSGAYGVTYEYDASGRRAAVQRPDGLRVSYEYDAVGDFRAVDVPGLGRIERQATARRESRAPRGAERDDRRGSGAAAAPEEKAATVRLPGAGTIEIFEDEAGRVARIAYLDAAGAEKAAFAQEFDPEGLVQSASDDGRTLTYRYDDAGRILSIAEGQAPRESYAYDEDGNLTRIDAGRAALQLFEELRYDLAGKLLSAAGTEWRYDARGNLAEKSSGTRYEYDEEGRLARIEFPDRTSASYRYDALGRRIEKSAAGKVTRYAYDGLDLVAEFDGKGRLAARYIHAPGVDHPLAMWRGDKWYYFATDRLGSVRALLDAQGQVVERYRYTAYGLPIAAEGTPAAISALHPFGFAGREFDAESGLYLMRARYFDPSVARFIQRDPRGLAGETNLYAYAAGNPVTLRDPYGTTSQPSTVWEQAKDAFYRYEDPTGFFAGDFVEQISQVQRRNVVRAERAWRSAVRQSIPLRYTDMQRFNVSPYSSRAFRAVQSNRALAHGLSRFMRGPGKIVGKIGYAEAIFANGRALGIAGSALWRGESFDLADALWFPVQNALWLLATALLFSSGSGFLIVAAASPVLVWVGAALLLILLLDVVGIIDLEEGFKSLLEWLGVTNGDPTYVQNPTPRPPLASLAARPQLLGAAGLLENDPAGQRRKVKIFDPGGALLAELAPGEKPARDAYARLGPAAYVVSAGDPPALRRIIADFESPRVDLAALSAPDYPGRLAFRIRAQDERLADVRLRVAPEKVPGRWSEIERRQAPLLDEPWLVDLHRLSSGDHVVEAVARDRAGNEGVARVRVVAPPAGTRPLALYGLGAKVSVELVEAPADAADEESGAPESARAAAGTRSDVNPAWVLGRIPAEAKALGDWEWSDAIAFGAARSHSGRRADGISLHYFIRARDPFTLDAGDNLIQYVYLDPASPPKQILVQLYAEGEQGEQRVYWGDDRIDLGARAGTPALLRAGPLPPAGSWVRLRVPAERFALGGAKVTGALWGQADGRAYWGATTKSPGHLDLEPESLVVGASPWRLANAEYLADVDLAFDLSAEAEIDARVESNSGEVLAPLHDAKLEAGSHRFSWDGCGADGALVPDGDYRFVVEARRGGARGAPLEAGISFKLSTLIARIVMPAEESLVDATVPIFGTAAGREFDRYSLEYGVGPDPTEWNRICEGVEPQSLSEPPLALEHRRTVHGNLGSFYAAGVRHENHDWSGSASELHTIRLRVTGKSGASAEDRVRLSSAPVAVNGGEVVVYSKDGRARLHIGAFSLRTPFHLFGLSAVDAGDVPALSAAAGAQGAELLSAAYELRPAGFRFERPARLEIDAAESERRALCVFDPVASVWRPLPRAAGPAAAGFVDEFPAGRTIVAVLADSATKAPLALDAILAGRRAAVLALAEPGAEVSLLELRDGTGADSSRPPLRTAIADASGLAILAQIYLAGGENSFQLRARDPFGNEGLSAQPIVLVHGADAAGAALETLSIDQRGDEFLLQGTAPVDAAASSPRRAFVRVHGESDAAGFWVDLVEAPGGGRFTGEFRAGAIGDPGRCTLQIARNGEIVTARAGERIVATAPFRDGSPPAAPSIVSPSHRASSAPWEARLAARTGWREGKASISLLAAPLDLREYSVLSFRYRLEPEAALHLLAKVNSTWFGMTLCGETLQGSAFRGQESFVSTPFEHLRLEADGAWHWAHLNVYEVARYRDRTAPALTLNDALLGVWGHTGYNEVSARGVAAGSGFEIADAYFRAAAGGARMRLEWQDPEDLSGIADYSFLLDALPDTLPEETGRGKSNYVELESPPGQETYYFHLRAKDGAGNWGAASHFPLTADALGPAASDPRPLPGARTGSLDLALRVSDRPGSGVDPDTIVLSVAGVSYTPANPALSFDAATETLTFQPASAQPPIAAWPDGARIEVELAAAADYAGNSLREPLRWEFTVDYSAQGAGACRMLTEQGGVEPAWSPNGDTIAYIVEAESRTLWVIDLESGAPRQVPVELVAPATPAWSPDGTQIAVSARAGRGRAIFAVDVANGAARALTDGAWEDEDPCWLADRSGIVFVRGGDLWRMAPNGGAQARFYADPDGARARRPLAAPNGKELIYWRSLYDEQVWILDLAAGTARPERASGREVDPCPGPGAGELVFAANARGSRLEAARFGGGASRALLDNGGWWDRYPRVSPDGGKLVFQSTRNGFWNLWLLEWLALGEVKLSPSRIAEAPEERASPAVRVDYDTQGFATASIQIATPAGSRVRDWLIADGKLPAAGSLEWDARDAAGKPIGAGEYLVEVVAAPPGGGDALRRGATLTVASGAPAPAGAVESPFFSRWARFIYGGAIALGVALVLGFFIIIWVRRRKAEHGS